MEEYSKILQILLKKRGFKNKNEITAFLNPSYDDDLHDPFLMLDMSKAVERILKAIIDGEKVAIYSDFDADGIPAGVILHDFFKKINFTNFINYIPHRDTEGYGLHGEAVEKLAKQGVSLIVTVDVGITAIKSVKIANELGVDVIITDHHEPQDELPDALAILNPKQEDCNYSFDGLCGAGVAYKLVQALLFAFRHAAAQESHNSLEATFTLLRSEGLSSDLGHSYLQADGMSSKPKSCGCPQESVCHLCTVRDNIPIGWEKWLLDLVAIATIADMVPLVGENRALAYWGLKVLRKSPRLGIQALCNRLRINQQLLDENDIGFSIAPRINASSRMGHPEDAFKLLIAKDIEKAEALAGKLENLNNKRKGRVAAITKQVKAKLAKMDETKNLGVELLSGDKVVVTGDPNWSPALVGLAAGSLADTLGKVVCIWGREGTGMLKGSCRRGSTNYSIVKMFETASDSLLGFGGHHAAGGFAVSDEQVHTLGNSLNTALNTLKIDNKQSKNERIFDIELALRDVHNATLRELTQLAPFGIGNPKPIIKFAQVTVMSIRHFGKEQNHLEIYIKDNNGASRKISKFFATAQSFSEEIIEGRVVDVFANLEESAFAGRRTLEIRIVDIV